MTLPAIALAVGYVLFLWWFGTGAVLWLDRRPRATYRWSLLAATGVAAAAVAGLVACRQDATPAGAFCGFACALILWAWHELSFLTGFVTGPRATPCPEGARGWARFRAAAATLIHHELALAVTFAGLAAVAWGAANTTALQIFAVLFVARLSAKLNLFAGVPNFSAEFFPRHLRHLTSYIRKAPVGAPFALSVLGLAGLAAVAAARALDPTASSYAATSGALVAALAALALLEHAFMALPVPDAALWRWALPASERSNPPRAQVALGPDTLKTPS